MGDYCQKPKSGFGWITETENISWMLWLHWIRDHQIDLVSTFMAAHAVPTEYKVIFFKILNLLLDKCIPKMKKS